MKLPRRTFLYLAAGSAALPAASRIAWAEAYPTRPVKIIVAFAAGGPTDLFARVIAQKLQEQTGKSFYIENVGGAGGNTGTARAAQSAPDGYTILVTGGNITNNPYLYNHVPYDPLKDFDAITLGGSTPVVLTVNRRCRRTRSKSLSRSSEPIPANTVMARRVPALRRSSSAHCSNTR